MEDATLMPYVKIHLVALIVHVNLDIQGMGSLVRVKKNLLL